MAEAEKPEKPKKPDGSFGDMEWTEEGLPELRKAMDAISRPFRPVEKTPELSDELRAFILDRSINYLNKISLNPKKQHELVDHRIPNQWPGYSPRIVFQDDIPDALLPTGFPSGHVFCDVELNGGKPEYPQIALGVRFDAPELIRAADQEPLIHVQNQWQRFDSKNSPPKEREGRLSELWREIAENRTGLKLASAKTFNQPGHYIVRSSINCIMSILDFNGRDLTDVTRFLKKARQVTDVVQQSRRER